jgi:hypothetical protein
MFQASKVISSIHKKMEECQCYYKGGQKANRKCTALAVKKTKYCGRHKNCNYFGEQKESPHKKASPRKKASPHKKASPRKKASPLKKASPRKKISPSSASIYLVPLTREYKKQIKAAVASLRSIKKGAVSAVHSKIGLSKQDVDAAFKTYVFKQLSIEEYRRGGGLSRETVNFIADMIDNNDLDKLTMKKAVEIIKEKLTKKEFSRGKYSIKYLIRRLAEEKQKVIDGEDCRACSSSLGGFI